MTYDFKLPDIGEGLVEGEIVKWHVKEGDVVKENQPLANVLTDKAEVEIPSPKSGRVAKLHAKEGQKVKVHSVIVTYELAGAAGGEPEKAPLFIEKAAPVGAAPAQAVGGQTNAAPAAPAKQPAGATVSATPAVRKLAGELKVELAALQGTGPAGRITEDDVRKATGTGSSAAGALAAPALGIGPEERIPFVGIRRRTAEKMAQSQRAVAAVTHVDEADVTALVALRAELKGEAQKRGAKLTYLPFIIRALAKTLPEYPDFNATLDEQGGSVVRKKYYNFGIAIAADTGLIVPVIKDAGGKDLWALASELGRLTDKVRASKVEVSDLQGGTITITNIGPIGGVFSTPIVNYPETAILGIMKIQKKPVVRDNAVVIRDICNLLVSFDHRVVDGAETARFLNTLIKHLENPRTLL